MCHPEVPVLCLGVLFTLWIYYHPWLILKPLDISCQAVVPLWQFQFYWAPTLIVSSCKNGKNVTVHSGSRGRNCRSSPNTTARCPCFLGWVLFRPTPLISCPLWLNVDKCKSFCWLNITCYFVLGIYYMVPATALASSLSPPLSPISCAGHAASPLSTW